MRLDKCEQDKMSLDQVRLDEIKIIVSIIQIDQFTLSCRRLERQIDIKLSSYIYIPTFAYMFTKMSMTSQRKNILSSNTWQPCSRQVPGPPGRQGARPADGRTTGTRKRFFGEFLSFMLDAYRYIQKIYVCIDVYLLYTDLHVFTFVNYTFNYQNKWMDRWRKKSKYTKGCTKTNQTHASTSYSLSTRHFTPSYS